MGKGGVGRRDGLTDSAPIKGRKPLGGSLGIHFVLEREPLFGRHIAGRALRTSGTRRVRVQPSR